ncbi:MAG: c-type cytochrome [Sedimentisphaerales bacterium]|nr:c-type cytochrome [Sedimentisphaerales bacterium]
MGLTVYENVIYVFMVVCIITSVTPATVKSLGGQDGGYAPVQIRLIDKEEELLVLGSTGRQGVILDRFTGHPLRFLSLPAEGSDIAIDNDVAYVTTNEPSGRILTIELTMGKCTGQFRVGHSPMGPVVSSDNKILCTANRFDNTVTIIDLSTKCKRHVNVVREPVALAMSQNGKQLFVANHLPVVRAFLDDENPYIGAEVSVIDVEKAQLIHSIELPNGSQGLRGIALSPDGRHVVVTHILSNYIVPTRTIEGGLINMNAMSLIDAKTLEWMATVILDDPNHGAANPWAVCFSHDGKALLITHAGTQELSVIDFPALLTRLESRQGVSEYGFTIHKNVLSGIRERLALGITGARSLAVGDNYAYVGGYFSNDVAIVNLTASKPCVKVVPLGKKVDSPPERLGEQYFSDASLCRQQWQSCATCHPDGRSDVMYWDLLNDGIGNTKNTKSLLMSMLTPPAMWRGVRENAGVAVRAGFHHILFAEIRPDQAEAIEAYLLHMKTVPSPSLDASQRETPKTEQGCVKCHAPGVQRGILTQTALRGKTIFEGKAGCVKCHPHPLFTTMQKVDPGLGSGVLYDVPTLIEVWRTAPYLHSGDALTLRETITDFNFMQKRGQTKNLSEQELNDLIAYLKSL